MKSMFTLVLCLAWLAALDVRAEQMQQFGDYEIHYNAMPADELTPEVARAYGIERSGKRGLMTVSVIKRDAQGVGRPIKAHVTAAIKMLTTQSIDVTLREVVEGEAIYYLGDFRVMPPVTLRFAVTVRPAGAGRDAVLSFSRSFY